VLLLLSSSITIQSRNIPTTTTTTTAAISTTTPKLIDSHKLKRNETETDWINIKLRTTSSSSTSSSTSSSCSIFGWSLENPWILLTSNWWLHWKKKLSRLFLTTNKIPTTTNIPRDLTTFTIKNQSILFSESELNQLCRNPSSVSNPCQFVKDHCAPTSYIIPYSEIYHCGFNGNGSFFLIALLLVGVYFFLLQHASAVYLATSLQQLADYLNLDAELAGVTLLSFGNGSPDLFTAIAGGGASTYDLILGGAIGAGIFTTTLVFANVILGSIVYFNRSKKLLEEEAKTEIQIMNGDDVSMNGPTQSKSALQTPQLKKNAWIKWLESLKPEWIGVQAKTFRGYTLLPFAHTRNTLIYTGKKF